METKEFLSLLDQRIHSYDLLCHPFYKAWSAGRADARRSSRLRRGLLSATWRRFPAICAVRRPTGGGRVAARGSRQYER